MSNFSCEAPTPKILVAEFSPSPNTASDGRAIFYCAGIALIAQFCIEKCEEPSRLLDRLFQINWRKHQELPGPARRA